MTTIPRELLNAKGTIDALFTLTFETDSATVSEMAEAMDVSRGTARERMDTLVERGLVDEGAALRDGSAVRVFSITDEGVNLTESLDDVLERDSDSDSEVAPDTDNA